MSGPIFSVITVVYNDRAKLLKTLHSVTKQTFDDYEYIVVDGGSTDGTVDVLQQHDGVIDRWISESDRGIYDAMNKGVSLASGEWVIFMNAGDIFYNEKVLESVYACGLEELTYGGCQFDNGKTKPEIPVSDIWKGMFASHQSIFVKRDLLLRHPFETQYRIAGDYEFLFYCYTSGIKMKRVSLIVSIMETGGISMTDRVASYKERLDISTRYSASLHVPVWRIQFHYQSLIFLEYFKSPFRRVLGRLISSHS